MQSDAALVSRNGTTAGTVVKVAVHEIYSEDVNSKWAREDLMRIKYILISDGKEDGSFLTTEVSGILRVAHNETNDVVLFQTSMGRFILDGSQIAPAQEFDNGIYSNASASDIIYGRIRAQSNREHLS